MPNSVRIRMLLTLRSKFHWGMDISLRTPLSSFIDNLSLAIVIPRPNHP
jgi:hypothetical protein